ncbi:MAG: hypothetical protein ACK41P_09975 [Asticcacaulis sp.]
MSEMTIGLAFADLAAAALMSVNVPACVLSSLFIGLVLPYRWSLLVRTLLAWLIYAVVEIVTPIRFGGALLWPSVDQFEFWIQSLLLIGLQGLVIWILGLIKAFWAGRTLVAQKTAPPLDVSELA